MHYPGDVVLRCQRFAGASREHVIFFASSPKPHTSNSSNAREQHDCNESNVSGPHIPVAGTENARYAEPSAGQQEHQEQQQQEGREFNSKPSIISTTYMQPTIACRAAVEMAVVEMGAIGMRNRVAQRRIS